MSTPLVVVGAGGFGRETLDVIQAINLTGPEPRFEVLGVVDDRPSDTNVGRVEARGVPLLGGIDDWLATGRDTAFVVAVGDPGIRADIARRFEARGLTSPTLVHPSAVIGGLSHLEAGVVVCAGAQVSTNVTIGRHCHLNPGVIIGHDTAIGEFVSINPGAIVSGDVQVHQNTLIGAGSVVLQGLTVNAGSLVGAAACVVRDVPAGTTVKGVPAR